MERERDRLVHRQGPSFVDVAPELQDAAPRPRRARPLGAEAPDQPQPAPASAIAGPLPDPRAPECASHGSSRSPARLLFTDIEASTRLLHALGDDGYLEALTEHRRVIRGGENYKACFAQM
jgi:hypothetical protein